MMRKKCTVFLVICLLLTLAAFPCAQAISLEDLLGDAQSEPESSYPNVDELFNGAPDSSMEKSITIEDYALEGTLNGYTFASAETMSTAALVLADACDKAGFAARKVGEEGTEATLYTCGEKAMLVLLDPGNSRVYVLTPHPVETPAPTPSPSPTPAPTPSPTPVPTDNYLNVTIDGESRTYSLESLNIVGNNVSVRGYCRNPLGKTSSSVWMKFSAETGPGASPESQTEMVVVYSNRVTDQDYWYHRYKGNNLSKGASCELVITKRSEDWKHYEGTLNALLTKDGRKIALTNGSFSITLP